MTLTTFFDLDTFLAELHAELKTEGLGDRQIKRCIAAALRRALEEGDA